MLAVIALAALACPPVCGPDVACAGDCFYHIEDLFVILDWNGDCVLDGDDVSSFAVDVFNGDPCADLYCDGMTNPDDLGDFITLFFAESPYLSPPCLKAGEQTEWH